MLTLWFAGSLLETSFGTRWIFELYATSVIGGGLLASLIAFTHVLHPSPGPSPPPVPGPASSVSSWPSPLRFGDQEFTLWFVLRLKAKYMVAIYLLLALATLLKAGNAFNALLELMGALAGFLYVRFAPRRGLANGLTDRWFGLQNDLTPHAPPPRRQKV